MNLIEQKIYDTISDAVIDKKFIKFWYQDTTDKKKKPQWRTVELQGM